MKKVVKTISGALLLLFVSFGLAAGATRAMTISEVGECETLTSQAKEFAGNNVFFITQWQADMCEAHGMAINARVE